MKRKKLFWMICFPLLMGLVACDDWLDVQQDTEKKASEMFDDYNGFKGALSGCYSALAGENLYGTRLTMSDVDALAGLWYIDPAWSLSSTLSACYALSSHDYTNDYAKEAIKSMYGAFYNTIIQANLVLEGCREKGKNIPDRQARSLVEGEAYAIRALCQLDILRLFGQVPSGATVQVSLPYSFTTGLDEMPSYYAYDDYITLLGNDIDSALVKMKDYDPLCDYTYKELNTLSSSTSANLNLTDDFLTNRHLRMNYWAVKALQARFYLYTGQNDKAYVAAMEVIKAKTKGGIAVTGLSSMNDYGSGNLKFNSESECLFGLWIKDLYTLTVTLLAGGETTGSNISYVNLGSTLVLSEARHASLFESASTIDIRYLNMWSRTRSLNSSAIYPSIRKYWVNKESNSSNAEGIIPLLRLSEMYLIAVETASLSEAGTLYQEYMLSKNVSWNAGFASEENRHSELMREYRREYFAEGQMFYFYKRHQTTSLWSQTGQVTETDYILPLPNTEFNPDNN